MPANSVLQSLPEESKPKSGVLHKDRTKLSQHLSSVLSNTYILYLKTQGFHWNVVGPMFYSLHKLSEAQYEAMAESVDTIAERIRAIGFLAPSSFKQFYEFASIEEETGAPTAEKMIEQLIQDNETCARLLRETVKEAEAIEDVKTADLLIEQIGQHEENAWMLRATIS